MHGQDDGKSEIKNKLTTEKTKATINIPSHGDGTNKTRPESLYAKASLFSKLFFTWAYPLLKLGLERPLADEDLPEILDADSSAANKAYFEKIWEAEQKQNPKQPSLHRALLTDYFKSVWYIQPLIAANMLAKIGQAIALGRLIDSFENGTNDGFRWATILFVCGIVILFNLHYVFFATWRKGMQLRIACVASIYSKSLRLSSTHQETAASTGKIMNLASNDVERFLLAALFISYLIWSPLQSLAILAVGWVSLGPAFAAGYSLLVFVFVPLQFYLGSRFADYRSKIANITDKRVTFVSQAIHGARVMKMSGYEWRFLDRIQALRKQEITQIIQANQLKAWNESLFFAANVVISVVIFLVHVLIGGTLTPGDVFTVFTLINVLQVEMTKHVSLGVQGASECYVSIARIQEFLVFPEIETKNNKSLALPSTTNHSSFPAIELSDVTCHWNEVKHIHKRSGVSDPKLIPALSNINVSFPMGELSCIIGTVGSGKSALIHAIVGELAVGSGNIIRNYETLSYASQDAWIMDGTVIENITMGLEMKEDWYHQVVNACGLDIDFKQFQHGDLTIVGDRGVQLSGGQRARIGLARALYRDADVLVADDPLSAVDAKVGRQLFNEALIGLATKRGKCVILATHQHQYVNESRCILVSEGRIKAIGSYDDCVAASDGKITAHAADSSVDTLEANPVGKDNQNGGIDDNDSDKVVGVASKNDDSREDKVSGVVRLETYTNYMKAMGGVHVVFLLFLLFCITQGSVLVTVVMMGRWAERPADDQHSWDIIGTIVGLGFGVMALAVFRAMISFDITIKASQQLHDVMALSVLRSKISFFDTNPLGRILNRFSADVGSNDDLLPQTLFDFFVILFIVIGAIATTITVLPFALIALPPLLWYFISVRRVFVTSTRELKRLEGLSRSPLFAMLSESLSGVATIRSNDSISYFTSKFENAHDSHTRAFFSFIACSRWVGFRMDSIMFMLMALVSFLSVLFQQEGWFAIDPAILGLSISMLLQLAGLFQWCIRQSAEVVNLMVSVERVVGFGSLEAEASLENDNDKELLQKDWPIEGAIDFCDLAVRYRPTLPKALDGATFQIPKGARVGVVGRTGSGKSTVVQTLFRLLEAEEGSISIDGVNIAYIGLHTLRTKISVIPQVPTLFSGCTVRENLDLFGIHSDTAIEKALEDAHLSDVIEELPNRWDSMVSEGGSNFSVGQRQLLCLARAILSKNKILVLDEATASVDRRTDQLLQESLQRVFHDATVIAVAHRLDTVIEHDLILVLGHGKVLEYGTPADLIRSGGYFSTMVDDTGDAMSGELKQRARQKEQQPTNNSTN